MEPIENDLRLERSELRKHWTTSFLFELDVLIEKCFLKPKDKKEQFITQEKISVDLLKLLQSQKRFQPATSSKINLALLAVFCINESKIGKVKSIHLDTNSVELIDMFAKVETKPFSDLIIFDVYSPELQFYFEKQKKFYDSFSYKDVFAFLTYKIKKEEKKDVIRMATVSGVQQIKLDIVMDYNK